MKFGQFIDNNRAIFPEHSCRKCGEETSPEPFFEKSNVSNISGSTV